jgi:hypothetical protein
MNGQTGRIGGPSRKRIKSGLCGSIDPSGSTFRDQPGAGVIAPTATPHPLVCRQWAGRI